MVVFLPMENHLVRSYQGEKRNFEGLQTVEVDNPFYYLKVSPWV
jgi:hypothetical protein